MEINDILQMQFQTAIQQSYSLMNVLSQEEQLILYALFKQANFGNRPTTQKAPSRLQMKERAKYDAWGYLSSKGRNGGRMTKEEAMVRYVSAIQEFQNSHGGGGKDPKRLEELMMERENADIVYTEEDEASIDESDLDDDENVVPKKATNIPLSDTPAPIVGLGLSQSTMQGNEIIIDSKHLLHQAASEGNLSQIQFLLSSSSLPIQDQINQVDDQGQTPLHLAADRGYYEIIQYFVENGANPNAVDEDGFSIIMIAVMAADTSEKWISIVKYLMEKGADANLEDDDGESAKSFVMSEGSDEMKTLFASLD